MPIKPTQSTVLPVAGSPEAGLSATGLSATGLSATGLPTTIDLHHHFIPSALFMDLDRRSGGRPRLVTDNLSVTLNPLLHDVDEHLRIMSVAGVDSAVLTYASLSVLGTDVCRTMNDALAEVARAHPGVLLGAVHVDIDNPDEAYGELLRGVELGMRALALPTSGRNLELDNPALDRLWEAAAGLRIPVLLHPVSMPTGSSTDYGLERSCGRPHETTIAAVRLLYGVLPRFAGLEVLAPHCGGTLPFLKGRLQMFFTPPGDSPRALPRTQRELADEGLDVAFEQLWARLAVDTAGNGGWTPVTRMALDVMGADRVCFGSDFPLESHSAATMSELVGAIVDLGLGAEAQAAVLNGNAARMLAGQADQMPGGHADQMPGGHADQMPGGTAARIPGIGR